MNNDYCIENDMPRQKELTEIEIEKNILKANALIEEIEALRILKDLLIEIRKTNVKLSPSLLRKIEKLCA